MQLPPKSVAAPSFQANFIAGVKLFTPPAFFFATRLNPNRADPLNLPSSP